MRFAVKVTGMKEIEADLIELPDKEALAAMLSVEKEVVDASPVDTRRFQSSWVASLDLASTEVVGTRLEQSRAGPNSFSRPSSFEGARVWTLNSDNIKGRTMYLSNSIEYAPFLAEGWSTQAANGWVDAAVRRGVANRARFLRMIQ